jgi:hypothetical protein
MLNALCKCGLPLVLLLVVGAGTSCGGSGDASSDGEASASAPIDAPRILRKASVHGIHTGLFQARLTLDNETKGEAVQWSASGPFEEHGKGILPNLSIRYFMNGGAGEVRGGLLALGHQVILREDGTAEKFSVPTSADRVPRCQEALESIKFLRLVKNLTSKRLPNSHAVFVTGELDPSATFRAFDQLIEPDACGLALQASGVSLGDLRALGEQVKRNFEKSEVAFTAWHRRVLYGFQLGIWTKSPPPRSEEVDARLSIALSRLNLLGTPNQPRKVHQAPGEMNIDAGAEPMGTAREARLLAGAALFNALWSALGGQ